MLFFVFHNLKFLDFNGACYSDNPNNPLLRIDPNNLRLVAIVRAKSTRDAYHLTNSVYTPWHEINKHNVMPLIKSRSTSIGDVICADINNFADSAMVVMPMGFYPLVPFLPDELPTLERSQ